MKIFKGTSELVEAVGEELGTSGWLVADQQRINTFADATGDHQWIHVDAEKAAQGPFGGPIAHGFRTLSSLPSFLGRIYRIDGVRMAIDCRMNTVEMPAPMPAAAKLRAKSRLAEVSEIGAVEEVVSTTIESQGGEKPACIVESIVRYVA